jgi:hypothetical protein
VKKILLAALLIAALIPVASAQLISAAGSSAVRHANGPQTVVHNPTKPKYCSPCLYYSGDTDSNYSGGANALWDDNFTSLGVDGQVWSTFKVKAAASATGLFINSFTSTTTASLINPTAYGISKKISEGNGGKSVCKGSAKATAKATGRTNTNFFVPYEFTIQIKKLKKACALAKGTQYWLNVYPTANDYWYESDSEENLNHFGAKSIPGQAFFNSTYFGANYTNASNEGAGFDDFSGGVTGQ